MKVTNEQRAEGGYNQSQKLYWCPTCNHMGKNNSFLTSHLINECNGPGRKSKKTTEENQDRLEEAMTNTRLWQAKQLEKESKAMFKAFKDDAIKDIESLREVNREVMESMIQSYYTKIF